MPDRIIANRLAALATALDDRMFAAAGDLSESAVAALMVIRRSEPISIQDIALRVGLTHSATVRLVDRLEADWLVRRLSRKGREVMVEATARGKRRARDLQDHRLATAAALMRGLEPSQRADLNRLVTMMLREAVETAEVEHTCRFCEQSLCRRDDDCPLVAGAPSGSSSDRIGA